ncbi:hypothetical protein PBAL39_09161 [Pedobacter sp. BAL39]|uniref:lasso peptide biosynthesis B2 protein n=1 Tax=Pedobacter sp. BAL39 TaxID=391596 RepID=UPI00015599C6|nr:lasso peptide biosynthesis B2 protein [Pedobacter sp. BAL39]EDM37300.1 hypothetical protein PBAL39_09161 [Pedobacter sp. BAL39]
MYNPLKKLAGKFNTLSSLSFKTKLLFIEALVISGWVKICLLFFPFNSIMGWLGNVHVESSFTKEDETLMLRREIKSAIGLCRKYAPWPTECYTMSLTGRIMLRWRKLSSTIYIGFKKEESGKYMGHAWLRANDLYISGYKESAGFTVNFIFS